MANLEFSFISRIVKDADFHSVEKMGITEEYLSIPEVREVFRFIQRTYHSPGTTGLVPSAAMISLNFPGFFWEETFDPVPIIAAKLRQDKIKTELLMLSESIKHQAELDPLQAMAELKAKTSQLSQLSEVGVDLTIGAAARQLELQYNLVASSGGVIGIPYPWAVLNEATQGLQKEQFIIIFGRPKSMKSWMAINIAVHAYIHSRKRVLFYTREMSPSMVAGRAASIITGVDYKAFKNGTLQPALKERVFTILNELLDDEIGAGAAGHSQPTFIITSDRSSGGSGGGGGVSWLQAKIRETKPDLVIVDGMYLMRDDRSGKRDVDWKAIAHISQDLKLTAQEFGVPLIGVTQANRGSEGKESSLSGLGYSDSFAQDADAVFQVSRRKVLDPQTGIKKTELYLNCPGLREGELDGIVVNGNPGSDFSYIRTLVGEVQEGEDGEVNHGARRRDNPPAYEQPRSHAGSDRRAPIIVGGRGPA